MSGAFSPNCSGLVDDACVFDILLPGSPFAGGTAEFEWESLKDAVAFDDCVTPGTSSTACQPTVASQHSTIAQAQPAGDVFDALDAFLETEFPMGDSHGQSPTESNYWTAAEAMSPAPTPTSPQPAHSASSSGTAAPSFSTSDVTAPLLCSPFGRPSNIPVSQSPCAQSAGAIAAAVSAVKGASNSQSVKNNSPLPRWKIYHMQQRRELLAPKQPGITPATSASADSAATGTAQAGAATQVAPAAVASASTASTTTAVTDVTLPVARANSVTSNFTGSIIMPSLSPTTLTVEHVLLLNALQQQLQLVQQQQVLSSKRSLATAGVPQAKRCRTAAAGSVAAQHLYGLRTPDPVNQLQELQAMQMQLQARILQSHQQQVERYQQQQLQALHQQLHMRLQLQQHQQALQLLHTTSCK